MLAIGIEELPADRLIELVEDFTDARDRLIGALFNAAMRSGRFEAICPETVDQLLHPTSHAFRIRKDNDDA